MSQRTGATLDLVKEHKVVAFLRSYMAGIESGKGRETLVDDLYRAFFAHKFRVSARQLDEYIAAIASSDRKLPGDFVEWWRARVVSGAVDGVVDGADLSPREKELVLQVQAAQGRERVALARQQDDTRRLTETKSRWARESSELHERLRVLEADRNTQSKRRAEAEHALSAATERLEQAEARAIAAEGREADHAECEATARRLRAVISGNETKLAELASDNEELTRRVTQWTAKARELETRVRELEAQKKEPAKARPARPPTVSDALEVLVEHRAISFVDAMAIARKVPA